MADLKISQLGSIVTVVPATDVLPVVQGATTYKMTPNQILGSGGVATLASATITGNLTVQTNKLAVTSTGVGCGTSSPLMPLDVRGGAGAGALFLRTTDPTAAVSSAYIQTPVSTGFSALVPIYGFWYQNSGMGNPAADTLNWIIASSEAMRLNSTGLGIGGSPTTGLLTVGATTNVSATANALTILSQRANLSITANGATDAVGTTINYSWANGGQGPLIFRNAAIANVMTLDASGNLLVNATSGSVHTFSKAAALGSGILTMVSSTTGYTTATFYGADNIGANAANTAMLINKNNTTGRSINGAGTINASGADYAEYMTKASDFVLSKGGIAGIDANGKLTNVFADAVSFVVKSTDPSYVGNDKWGVDLEGDALEAARQLVDRIAFAGQVPVNVTGAKAGDYIVPVVDGTGIKGISVSKPTFEQYQLAVGKVIAIDTDGRARIIVKVA